MESAPVNGDRNETVTEGLDRNWNELLQELRVTQTGVQILAGFLLTLPFQQRFTELDDLQTTAYLVSLSCAVLATALLATSLLPVAHAQTATPPDSGAPTTAPVPDTNTAAPAKSSKRRTRERNGFMRPPGER